MSQLKHVICPVCEKGILTVVAEVGVEAEGGRVKFQSLSAAQGRVCHNVIIVASHLSRSIMDS